jgi:ribonuclease R
MFMVEANEAVARLLTSVGVPHLRRTHPEPEGKDSDRLRQFISASGHKIPREMDRKSLQALLANIKGKPEAFAINLAVLKSLTRAEYSPREIGHYALASEEYCHFTSPIRRYADLTIHRLLDAYFKARGDEVRIEGGGRRGKVHVDPDEIPTYDDLVDLGKHLSFTERRSEDAERELRQVKILTLMQRHVGEDFSGVVTGITNFGLFIQLDMYLVDGLIRYEDMAGNDYWEVDERSGSVRGRRTQTRISIGDVIKTRIVKVDVPRRELTLAIVQLHGRSAPVSDAPQVGGPHSHKKPKKQQAKVLAPARHAKGKQRPNKQKPRRGGRN